MQPSTFAVLLVVFLATTVTAFPSQGYSKSGRHGGGFGPIPWYGGGGGSSGGYGSYKSYIAIADKYLDHNDGQRYISHDGGYGGQDNNGYDNGYDNRGGNSHGDYGYGTHQEPVLYKK